MAASSGAIRAGRAFVELFADPAKLQSGLQAAEVRLRQWGRRIRRLGAEMMYAGGGGLAAGLAGLREFAMGGNALHLLSQQSGLAAETLSELSFAAQSVGGNLQTVQTAMAAMNGMLMEAHDGSSAAARSLAELGLNFGQLQGMAADERLLTISDALRGVESETRRAALAQQVFGGASQQLLPLLRQGREGFQRLGQQARELGVITSSDAARSANELVTSFNILKSQLAGLVWQIGGAILPSMQLFVRWLGQMLSPIAEWISENRTLIAGLFLFTAGLVGLGGVLVVVGHLFSLVSGAAAVLGVMVRGVLMVGTIAYTAALWGVNLAIGAFNAGLWLVTTAGSVLGALLMGPWTLFWAAYGAAVWFVNAALGAYNFVTTIASGVSAACAVVMEILDLVVTGGAAAWWLIPPAILAAIAAMMLVIAVIGGVVAGLGYLLYKLAEVTGTLEYFEAAWQMLANELMALWDNIVTAATIAWNEVLFQINRILPMVTRAWASLTSFFSSLWSGIQSTAVSAWSSFTGWIGRTWSAIVGHFQNTWGMLTEGFGNLFGGIVAAFRAGNMEAAFDVLKAALSLAWIGAIETIKINWLRFKTWILDVWEDLAGPLQNAMVNVWARIRTLWEIGTFNIKNTWFAALRLIAARFAEVVGFLIHSFTYANARLNLVGHAGAMAQANAARNNFNAGLTEMTAGPDANAHQQSLQGIEDWRQGNQAGPGNAAGRAAELDAAENAGVDAIRKAQLRLFAARLAAESALGAGGGKKPSGIDRLGQNVDSFGANMRGASTGTFSAAAAAAMSGGSTPAERTARNTAQALVLLQQVRDAVAQAGLMVGV